MKFASKLQALIWARFAANGVAGAMAVRITDLSGRSDNEFRAEQIAEMADALLAEYNKRVPSERERAASFQGEGSDMAK